MSQPMELLAQLKLGRPMSALAIRDRLGIQNPADAVYQLRKIGYRINMSRDIDTDTNGRLIRCAHYHLIEGITSGFA